ncbi:MULTISPECIES: 5-formyltetrahydrofolate cyclo-ligase [Candidatus Ichthyocystis]|uniref:5-formyltetrahydrofolate cyclo-ligase n=1 Tax=Candidatus Ichthyocystis hellenicum TaxID=1561003 RepID=A0A0S4M2R4_9BURK|nr:MULTISPECIES: 5-formyltetrahydrofolate cyclo-ligase [Ichthyocystis]CUT17170.1 putative 5-formyltetrahydrofolate cyclo-ligase family protein [Candidatus Ichthyocystis hellenicum]
MSVLKKDLRKSLLSIRKSMSNDYKIWADRAIQSKLYPLFMDGSYRHIGFYFPILGEPDLLPMASVLSKSVLTILLPHTNEDDSICFCQWCGDGSFARGRYFIPEPKFQGIIVETVHAVVVPMLGWTRSGYRVGYGKGCFDRFFSTHANENIFKVGVSYSSLAIDKNFEEDHDLPMNIIVTEKDVITCQ